ncbi:HAMP domain-containing histidine kinase [bacterium]|nr:HAMP domain-containing histidine kinase [bacterium]
MDNQDYNDFISTVSHELRTPLTSIRGFSQTMLASWDRLDDESKKKFLKIIEEQSNRLINLVENMLSITKFHSGSDKVILKEVMIKPVVDTVIQILKNQYRDKIFEINIAGSIPPIYSDKDKFQQILTNLIENACKYGDENSTVKIQTDFCEDCKFVSVKISNYGVGIDEKDYEKIFTKFSRIDNPLTRKVQGSGLGLYITKNLTEKMGGKISLTSTPAGENYLTTFEIQLPVCDIEVQAREKCSP